MLELEWLVKRGVNEENLQIALLDLELNFPTYESFLYIPVGLKKTCDARLNRRENPLPERTVQFYKDLNVLESGEHIKLTAMLNYLGFNLGKDRYKRPMLIRNASLN